MIVDSHCHLELEDFDEDRDRIIGECERQGLKYLLTVATEERYFKKVVQIAEQFGCVFGAIGIHPHLSDKWKKIPLPDVENFLKHKKIVAYGEIGLDFYKNYSPPHMQKEAFSSQLLFAKDKGMPVIIHSRNSDSETLEILDSFYKGGKGGVIHCFSYDKKVAQKFLDRGFYISIPGTITYKNNGKLVEVVRYVPLNRILVETDAPFLTPYPERGKRNLPYYVKYVLEKIAEIKEIDVDVVGEEIVRNFETLFLSGGSNEASCNSR